MVFKRLEELQAPCCTRGSGSALLPSPRRRSKRRRASESHRQTTQGSSLRTQSAESDKRPRAAESKVCACYAEAYEVEERSVSVVMSEKTAVKRRTVSTQLSRASVTQKLLTQLAASKYTTKQ